MRINLIKVYGLPRQGTGKTMETIIMIQRILLSLLVLAALIACGQNDAPATSKEAAVSEVNVYSSRHYDTDLALYDDFTAATGIKVNLIEAGADELIERIQSEGEFSPADLLITVDAGRLWRAEQANIFDTVASQKLDRRVPENLRHPEGLWYGLSKRARVIIYNAAAGKPEPLNSYADLANPVHAGKVCIRSSSNIYNMSLLAGIISHLGAEAAESWAKGVVANFARSPQSNDTGQIKAVASGECQIAVVNTYYLARLKASEDPQDQAIANGVAIVFPDQDGQGTHVNVSGAGVVKGAPNRDNAIAFLEYLTEDSAQQYFANGNNEYPVVPGIAASSAVVSLGQFKEDSVNAAELGRNQTEAIRVFDRAGWN